MQRDSQSLILDEGTSDSFGGALQCSDPFPDFLSGRPLPRPMHRSARFFIKKPVIGQVPDARKPHAFLQV